MIKMQLDWSVLTGLIENNDGLLVEIAQGVKANFAKTYVKNLMNGNDVKQLKKDMIEQVRIQVSKHIADTRNEYGRLKILNLKPEIVKKIEVAVRDEFYPLLREIAAQTIAEHFSKDEIERRVKENIDRKINDEVNRRVKEKMVAVMQAASN